MACLNIPKNKRKALRESINYYKKLKREKLESYKEKPGEGIDINSKFSTALNKVLNRLGNTRYDATMSKGRLITELKKLGVSEKEITMQLSSTNNLDVFSTLGAQFEDKALIGKVLNSKSNFTREELGKLFGLTEHRGKVSHVSSSPITIEDGSTSKYNSIIQAYDRPEPSTYKVRNIGNPILYKAAEDTSSHFNTKGTGLLGWTRSHTDELDDEVVHVLDEFQSDWAQGDKKSSFPIDYVDFKKIAIVDALDQAITSGLNRVIIPIDREQGLEGSKAITAMYRALGNTDKKAGILFKLQKDLKASGLDIDIAHKVNDGTPERWEIKLPASDNIDVLEDSLEMEVRYVAKQLVDKSKPLVDMPDNTELYRDFSPDYPEAKTVGDLRAMYDEDDWHDIADTLVLDVHGAGLEDIVVQAEILQGKAEALAKVAKRFNISTDITDISSRLEDIKKQKKFRWDMLSLLAATGLTGEYAKLQKEN